VRQGSLWIFSLLLDFLSHPPTNTNYVFFLFFLLLLYFLKNTLPQRGFHPRYLPWAPQGRFSPRDPLIIFHFFSSLGHLTRFSTQKDGNQVSHGDFHLNPYSFFSFSVP